MNDKNQNLESCVGMTKAETRAQEAIEALVAQSPRKALSLITGNFVGLLRAAAKQAGQDPDKEIYVDGGTSRSITIHAHKAIDQDIKNTAIWGSLS